MTRPIRVLVADDEMKLRELMVRELARKGHEVEGVGRGVRHAPQLPALPGSERCPGPTLRSGPAG